MTYVQSVQAVAPDYYFRWLWFHWDYCSNFVSLDYYLAHPHPISAGPLRLQRSLLFLYSLFVLRLFKERQNLRFKNIQYGKSRFIEKWLTCIDIQAKSSSSRWIDSNSMLLVGLILQSRTSGTHTCRGIPCSDSEVSILCTWRAILSLLCITCYTTLWLKYCSNDDSVIH